MAIKRSSHAVYELNYHFAWAVKYRKRVFNTPDIKNKTKDIFQEIAAQYDLIIEEISIQSDHVHMLIMAPPRMSPARVANILKSVSTKLIFKNFPKIKKQHFWGGGLWVGGYFVRSSGPGVTTQQIKHYIQNQDQPVLW
jgi:putative transposase